MPTEQEVAHNLKSKFKSKQLSSPDRSKHEVEVILFQIMVPLVEKILKNEFLDYKVQKHIDDNLIVDANYIWEELLKIEVVVNSLTKNHLYNTITYDMLSEAEKENIVQTKRSELYYANCVYNMLSQTITMKQVYLDIIIEDLKNHQYSNYTYGFFATFIHEAIHALYHLIDAPFHEKEKLQSEQSYQEFLLSKLFDINPQTPKKDYPGNKVTSYMIDESEFPSFYRQIYFMLQSGIEKEKIIKDVSHGYCDIAFSNGQYGHATCIKRMEKFVRRVFDIIKTKSSRDIYQQNMGQQQLDLGNWYEAYNQTTFE